MELTDLPPEVLEMIFSYLQLNLQGLLELSMVCRLFRDVARRVPVPVKIPLQDSQLAVMQVIVLSFFKCYLEVSCIDHAVINSLDRDEIIFATIVDRLTIIQKMH